jgi:hypothetical protein
MVCARLNNSPRFVPAQIVKNFDTGRGMAGGVNPTSLNRQSVEEPMSRTGKNPRIAACDYHWSWRQQR